MLLPGLFNYHINRLLLWNKRIQDVNRISKPGKYSNRRDSNSQTDYTIIATEEIVTVKQIINEVTVQLRLAIEHDFLVVTNGPITRGEEGARLLVMFAKLAINPIILKLFVRIK